MKTYHEYKQMVEDSLIEMLPEIDARASVLGDAMKYSLTAGGKRIRPVLCLAACELCGGDAQFALPFAAAIEFIQTYSLIHDDLPAMDNDDYRRGKLTNHKVFGEDIAILAGDGLLSAAYERITEDMLNYTGSPELLARKVLAQEEIARGTGCRGMVAGQIADLKSEHEKASPDMMQFIHRNKTAAFIKASVLAGARLGAADESQMTALREYSDAIGLAFQIVDDIQDVIGDEKQRGKRTGGDAENEKSTYPSVFGLEESRKEAEELIGKARGALVPFGSEAQPLIDLADYLEKMMN